MGPSYKVVVGYARVSASAPASRVHDQFVLAMQVDPATHIVTAVDSTAVTTVARQFVNDLLLGIDLSRPQDKVLEIVDEMYLGFAAGSIKQAFIDASRRYRMSNGLEESRHPEAS